MKHRLLLIYCLLITLFCRGQNPEIDSLNKKLISCKPDTQKVNILNRLAKLLEDKTPQLSLQLAKQAYVLSEKLHFIKGKAMSLVYHADFYYFRGDVDSAEIRYEEAIKLFISIKDRTGMAWTYMVAGNNMTSNGRYEKAIRYILQSVKLYEETNNKDGYAWALETAGSVFGQLGAFDKAIEYIERSLKLMEDMKNEDGIASCYNTLGIISDYTGNLEKALAYYFKALPLREKNHNTVETISTKANIGVIYIYMNNYSKAISYLKDAVRMAKKYDQQAAVASSLINLGEAYMNTKNYSLSLTSLKEGCVIAGSLGLREYQQEGVRLLSELYFATGYYKNAYKYEKQYTDIKDTILQLSNNKHIFEMNTKYESEKKDKELLKKDIEISKQQTDTRQKLLQRNSFIAGFVLMIVFAFFIFKGYKEKQKINIEITKQKHLIEEKQKEILDSIFYARRIQRALITPEKYIEKVLNKELRKN